MLDNLAAEPSEDISITRLAHLLLVWIAYGHFSDLRYTRSSAAILSTGAVTLENSQSVKVCWCSFHLISYHNSRDR